MPNARAALLLLTVAICVTVAHAQSGRTSNSQDAGLSKPVDWGFYKVRMFKNVDTNVDFSLQTSWIPGENRKGMFRYKLSAFTDTPDGQSDDAIEALMNRVHACLVTLNLYDADGFVLRAISIPFTFAVDEKVRKRGLFANTASQMESSEYRQFLGVPNKSGSWSVVWNCPYE